MNKNAKFINTTSPSSLIFIYDAEVVLAFIFVAFIYYLHCGKILLRVKQNRKLISLNLSCMHFLFRNAVYTKKYTQKSNNLQTKNFSSVWFFDYTVFFVSEIKKIHQEVLAWRQNGRSARVDWKQWESLFWKGSSRSMITKQVNCAANKEVYEATNQPQCSFFWWVPLNCC